MVPGGPRPVLLFSGMPHLGVLAAFLPTRDVYATTRYAVEMTTSQPELTPSSNLTQRTPVPLYRLTTPLTIQTLQGSMPAPACQINFADHLKLLSSPAPRLKPFWQIPVAALRFILATAIKTGSSCNFILINSFPLTFCACISGAFYPVLPGDVSSLITGQYSGCRYGWKKKAAFSSLTFL